MQLCVGLYYGVTISLVSFATGLSVVTLSIHHRGMRGGRLPQYLNRFLFNYLAPALLLKLDIPKKRMLAEKLTRESQARSDANKEPESSLSCKIPLVTNTVFYTHAYTNVIIAYVHSEYLPSA